MILLLLGCSSTPVDSGGPPSIRLVAPTEGNTVCGNPLRVEVEVENFQLVPPVDTGEEAEPGTGHVDITLNGQDAAMAWETTTDIGGVGEGDWQLKVELSSADHTPVEPYAGQFVYITVSETAC